MQVLLQALFSPADDGNEVVIDTNSQATLQTLISSFCTQKGIAYSSKLTIFDSSKRPLPHFNTLQSLGINNGQSLFIGYKDSSFSLEKRWPLLVAVAALIIGLVGILALSLSYGLSGGVVPFDFGIVMDAGSSKTNVLLYKWLGSKYKGTGCVKQIDQCKAKGGIAKLNPNSMKEVLECTKNVTRPISESSLPKTPLYFAATAGMRLLNLSDPAKVETVLSNMKSGLNDTGMSIQVVDIMSGRDEGLSAWITTNFLKDTLDVENTAVPWTPTTYGALDLGGASTQIAFALPPNDTNANDTEVQTMELYGQFHDVFSRSYLCFGRDESSRRYRALLIQNPKKNKILDPCAPGGFEQNMTGSDLFDQPCTNSTKFNEWIKEDKTIKKKIYTFVGTNDYEACKNNVSRLLDANDCRKKNFQECFEIFDRPKKNQKFLAFANYVYTTEYLNLTSSSLDEYQIAVKNFCEKTFAEIGDNSSYAAQYCFNAVYIHEVLINRYEFNNNTWTDIEFVGEIDKKELGWSLGYMINATNLIPKKNPSKKLISPAVLIVCLLIFILAVVATIVFLVHNLCRKRDSLKVQSRYQSP